MATGGTRKAAARAATDGSRACSQAPGRVATAAQVLKRVMHSASEEIHYCQCWDCGGRLALEFEELVCATLPDAPVCSLRVCQPYRLLPLRKGASMPRASRGQRGVLAAKTWQTDLQFQVSSST